MSAANNRSTGQCRSSAFQKFLVPASVAIAVGDLCFKSRSDSKLYPMSSFTWDTSLAVTQAAAARYFAGISNLRRLSTETDTDQTAEVLVGGEFRLPCAALGSAAHPGELVTFADNGNSTLSNTNVIITTDPNLAIGRVNRYAVTGSTSLNVVFIANATTEANFFDNLPPAKYTTGALQAATFPAGALTGAKVVHYNNTGTTPAALTVRTAAQMWADTPGVYVGMSYTLFIRNSSGSANTATITADGGATVTLTGTMTIAQNTTRMFVVTFVSPTAVTIQSMGLFAAGA